MITPEIQVFVYTKLGVTYGHELQTNTQIFDILFYQASSVKLEYRACMQHFLPKEENCFCRLYILNYALRQIMGVTGHRYGCQHCFLCMQYVASCYAPNFEKVGDILVSACPFVCMCVCVCIHVRDIILKLHVWIPHGKIADAYFWFFPELSPLVK